jgi:hypothetical protein
VVCEYLLRRSLMEWNFRVLVYNSKLEGMVEQRMKTFGMKRALGLAIVTLLMTACVPTQIKVTCGSANSKADPPVEKSVAINLYVDGTPSMRGYVSQPESRYAQTLKTLLSVLQDDPIAFDASTRNQSREVQYFRLGKDATTGKAEQKISRDEFRSAGLPEFYGGAQFPNLAVSQIDAAIQPPDEGNELTVIVTDLYQEKEDAGKIANAMQTYLKQTQNGGAVGVLGIRSEFNGTVYTEGQSGALSFEHNSQGKPDRPFYVLLIGNLEDVHYYVESLIKRLNFGQEIKADLFSPYRLYKTPAQLIRKSQDDLTPEERKLVSSPKGMKYSRLTISLPDPAVQPLLLRTKRDPIQMEFQATTAPIPRVLISDDKAFQTTITPMTAPSGQSKAFQADQSNPNLQQALKLSNWKPNDQQISFTTEIQPDKLRAGIYFFEATTTLNTTGDPLPTPDWWTEWNSPPTSQKGEKTHDLKGFMSELRGKTIALMRAQPPLVGRFCYVIQRD